MVYGIQATGDTIITDIARAVAPEDKHRNVENRLSRNLQAEGLHEKIRDAIQTDAMRAVDRATDGRGIRVYDRGISHDRRSPRSGALAWVGQTRLLRLQARQREEVHYTHEPEGPLELEGDEVKRMARWPRESSGRSCATEAGRRKPWSRRRTTDISPAEGVPKGLATRGADAAGMGRVVVPRRRIARGRAKRRGVLRVRKPGAASVGETCARNQRFCRGRAG